MRRQLLAVLMIIGCWGGLGCAPTTHFPTIDNQLAEAEARKQRAAMLEAQVRHDSKLQNVAFPILTANAELCGDTVRQRTGVNLVTLENFQEDWREIVRTQLGVGDRLTVVFVVSGSPADFAGIKRGDKILRVGDEPLGTGKSALEKYIDMFREHGVGDVSLTVKRRGEERTFIVESVAVCDYPVVLVTNDAVNAWADGKKVYITTGMLRFAETEDELALVVGHELAHNTRSHIESKLGNVLLGTLVGAVITGFTGVDVTNLGAQVGAGAFSL